MAGVGATRTAALVANWPNLAIRSAYSNGR